jgi:glycosidase
MWRAAAAFAQPIYLESGGVIAFEAEGFAVNSPRGAHAWTATNDAPGFHGSAFVRALPDIGSNVVSGWTTASPQLDFTAHFATSGVYYVWLRARPTDGNDDSVHVGLNGQTNAGGPVVWSSYGGWGWTNANLSGGAASVVAPAPGPHTFNLWMREDGIRIDRVVLTRNASFKPRKGNAWHIPHNSEPGVGFMRAPIFEIYSNTAVTIFSGNQFQGGGEAGNQLQTGSAIFYKHATGAVWSSVPMTFHSTSANNIYYSGTIPAGSFAAGDTVEYYIRVPYSDYLPTFLCQTGAQSTAVEDESYARANPFTYRVLAPTRTGHPSPGDWRDQNFYFIFLDRFNDGDPSNNNANPQSGYNPSNSRRIHGGDFKGIQRKLDYIQALGATALWITPIPQNVGHSGYHGYGADNFYALQPNWGTTNDLVELVEAVHARGMYICLDIVLNHQGNRIDSANPGWSTSFSLAGYPPRWTTGVTYPPPFNLLTNFHNNGHIQNYVDPDQILGELSGLDDLRTETLHVRTNLVNIYKHWITVADFDGFRLDTVKHADIGVWQHFNSEIRSFARAIGKTNFFQFGEVYDGNDAKCGFYTGTRAGGAFANDSVVDFPLYFKVNDVFAAAAGNTKQIEDRYNAIAGNYDPYAEYRLVTFIDNHDRPRFMNAAGNNTNRLALALAWLYTARGIPCLYYGTEQNFNGGNDPANREDMFDGQYEQGPSLGDNFNMTQGSFLRVAQLNNFRRLYPSLRRGTHVNLWNNPSGPGLFAYARRLGSEEIFVVFNTAGSAQTLPARPTIYPAGTTLVNLLNTNETVTVTAGIDGIPPIAVPAGGFKMFIASDRVLPLDPVVVAQTPAHYATNVNAAAPVVLTFSKPMNTASVHAAFSVQPPVGGSFAWSPDRTVMTFAPSPGLTGSTAIVVRVGTNAQDSASGNRFYAPFETLFHTAPASYTDNVPPVILVQAPAPDATVSNTIVISGTATDNAAVAAVELQVDGGDWAPASGAGAWTYAIDTRNFLNGVRQIAARARDTAGNLSAPALLSLRFFNIPGSYEARLAAGNFTAVTNCDGRVWQPDQPWHPGGRGWLSGTNGFIANTISNLCASAQPLFQRERYSTAASTLDYRFDLPEGRYEITLLQTETWVTGVNQRVFDLYIEGIRTLTNFDIFAASGGMNLPLVQTFAYDVADARLDLHFIPWADNARVSGIGVRRIGDVDTDLDGIPNWWMRAWFDHPTGQDADQSQAHQDADGDGFANREEYIAGTSPIDPAAYPLIRDFLLDPMPRAFVPSAQGRLYTLQWKPDPLATGEWITIAADQPGTGDLLPIPDTNAPAQGIYRVLIRVP